MGEIPDFLGNSISFIQGSLCPLNLMDSPSLFLLPCMGMAYYGHFSHTSHSFCLAFYQMTYFRFYTQTSHNTFDWSIPQGPIASTVSLAPCQCCQSLFVALTLDPIVRSLALECHGLVLARRDGDCGKDSVSRLLPVPRNLFPHWALEGDYSL